MDPQDTEDKPAFCIRVKLIQTNHRSIDLFFHLRTVSVSYDGDTVLSTNRNCKVLVFDDVQWNCVINAIQYGYLLWVWHTTWLWSNWKRVWHTTWLWSNWIPHDFQTTENVCDIPHDFQATKKVCHVIWFYCENEASNLFWNANDRHRMVPYHQTGNGKLSDFFFFFFFWDKLIWYGSCKLHDHSWLFHQSMKKTGCCREVICQLGTLYGGRCPCGEVAVFKVVVLVRKFTRLMWEIQCVS